SFRAGRLLADEVPWVRSTLAIAGRTATLDRKSRRCMAESLSQPARNPTWGRSNHPPPRLAAAWVNAGAGYGRVSGSTRTAVVSLNGYLPPLGNVNSTKNAV